jgi:hypothetical protein
VRQRRQIRCGLGLHSRNFPLVTKTSARVTSRLERQSAKSERMAPRSTIQDWKNESEAAVEDVEAIRVSLNAPLASSRFDARL